MISASAGEADPVHLVGAQDVERTELGDLALAARLPTGDGGYPLGLLRHLPIAGDRRLEAEGIDPLDPLEEPGGGHEVVGRPLRQPCPVEEPPADEVQAARPSPGRSRRRGLCPEGGLGEVVSLADRPVLVGFDGGGGQPREGGLRVAGGEMVVADDPGVAAGGLQHGGEARRDMTPSALSESQRPRRRGCR